ncbi:BTE_collapsed_G0033240.mRNA.1.CDS.1 [Saccharomyces cerevisiae]|nr:BTE_collapsed_G0033240.mRNA.1.CDS.1 [Saccharomyces cerevisiae]
MSTDNSQKDEGVPLLSPYSSSPQLRKKKRNQKRRKDKFVGHLKSDSRRPTQLLHDNLQHNHGQITDFDQIDSWGMLHESDSTSNDIIKSEDPSLKGAFIDHRPSMSQPREGPQSVSSTVQPQPIMKFSTPSYKKPAGLRPSDQNRSLVSDLSPSELESWLKRRKSVHKSFVDENSPTDRRQSNANNDVVIDVDALMNHVNNNASTGVNDNSKRRKKKRGSDDSSNKNSKSTSSDSNDEEDVYNSRPSSSLSSNNSSLDDVCLVLDDEGSEVPKAWPDCTVLEEFSKEETERLRSQAIQDAEAFHFQYDEDEEDGILFSKPIVTNIDVPELGNRRVNETENLKNGLGRNIQYPPHIISNNPEHFRFTYFRVDLDSTVHSPTISGLLQPGQKFQDLFVASIYSQDNSAGHIKTHPNSPTPGIKAETVSQLQGLTAKNPSTLSSMSVANIEDVPPFWLDVSNPTEEEMKILSKAFGIHPLTTEDIFLGEVREKVELFRDYYLICFRSFDIVAEKHVRRRRKEKQESATLDHESISRRKSQAYGATMSNESNANNNNSTSNASRSKWLPSILRARRRSSANRTTNTSSSSYKRRVKSEKKKMEENEKFKRKSGDRHKPREGELEPLNVYIIVFRTGVLTFHFAPTPHPINVRRRARLLKDYLNVTSDWIAYALIDDITDAFAPMIELIEDEVYEIEDAILKMHQSDDSSDSDSSDSDSDSGASDEDAFPFDVYSKKTSYSSAKSSVSSRSMSTSEASFNANLIGWKRKGDMLRRIGECRKRVMSILRLLGSKADVIKGFAKRYNEQWEASPQSEIAMYLGDIQDHIVTMVSSLNHYEKLLSRSHSNYLAQINIDMTKVNNDMNDVLGKITILGTIVLPMNVITGLWGMNVIVPGQYRDSLTWFIGIVLFMCMLACSAYMYTKRRFGF